MNSTQQQCFMLAAEYLNFTKAAERLYITQPALSRNISALEEELNLQLFVRSNNILHITPGGKMLYEWMKTAKGEFEYVLSQSQEANSGAKMSLKIGFVKSELPPFHVARAFRQFRRTFPDVQLEISHYPSRELVTLMEENAIDVALMIGSAAYDRPRLITQWLATYRRCLAVSINHHLSGRESVAVADLENEVFVSVKPHSSPTLSAMTREVCATAGFKPKLLEAQSPEEQLEWIESGKGVGLLIENHAQRINPLFDFIRLDETFTVDMVCAWDRLNNNPHIQEFVKILTEVANQNPPHPPAHRDNER